MSEAVKTYDSIKEVQLEDILIPTNLIESKEYPTDEIYELKVDGNEYAPIWAFDLKDYLEHHEVAPDTQIKIFGSENWRSIFEHPMFQRRRPQIVENDNDLNSDESYQLLLNGKKVGPYTISEITNMIDQKEILFTDMVCNSEQTEWTPIFKITNFDRRNLKSIGDLPGRPASDIENTSLQEVVTTLENKDYGKEGALADLAFIGNLKSAKNKSLTPEEKQEISFHNSEEESAKKKEFSIKELNSKYIIVASAVALLLGVIIFWESSPSRNTELKTDSSKLKIQKRKVKTQPRILKAKPIKTKAIVKRRPAARRKAITKKIKPFRSAAQKYQYKKPEASQFNNAQREDDSISDNIAPEELEPSDDLSISELEEEELFDAETEL